MPKTTTAIIKDLSRSEITRFLFVGLVCFVIEFLTFTLLIDVFHVRYTDANLPFDGAAVICSYYLSKKVVFDNSNRHNEKLTFLLFIAFTILGIALNQFLLWFLVDSLAWNVKVSKVVTVALVAIFNYVTKRWFVFN